MIRTWGLAVSDTPLDAPSRCGHGVFQFFEHTLVVTVNVSENVERTTAKTLAQLVVRLVYNAFKSFEGHPDVATLTKVIEHTHHKLVRLRGELGLPQAEMAVTLVTFGPSTMSCVIVGGQSMYLVRGAELERISDASRGGQLVGGGGPPAFRNISDVPLEPRDVVVLFGEDHLAPIVERHLTRADWSLPQQATRRILTVIEEEIGHETMMVSVLMDKSPEFIRPSIPPTIASLLESLRISVSRAPGERETFEDVSPQWGTGTFLDHEQQVYEDLEELTLEEKEPEPEPEDMSFLAQLARGALDLWEHLQQRFGASAEAEGSEDESKKSSLVLVYTVLVLVLIVLGGLVVMGDTSSGMSAGVKWGLFGAGGMVVMLGGAMMWRRRQEDEAADAIRRAARVHRAAGMDACWRETVSGQIVEVLRGGNHTTGLALVGQGEKGWALAVARGPEDGSGREFEAHVIPGRCLLEAHVRSAYETHHSGKGGAKGVSLYEVALDVRTSLPELPYTSISLLEPDKRVSPEESREMLAQAYRWQGVTLALRAGDARLDEGQRRARLAEVRDRGLLAQDEYDRLCAALKDRRSRALDL